MAGDADYEFIYYHQISTVIHPWSVASQKPRPRRRGFTLVEIMTLVVIIGLLAIMAMPAFQKARIGTQNSRIANDLRVFSHAFENYVTDSGAWPANASPGTVPEGMGGYLNQAVFEGRTVVGGRYCWNFQSGTYEAGIAVTGSILDDLQAQDIDRILDDGKLNTGSFQKDGADFVLILEP